MVSRRLHTVLLCLVGLGALPGWAAADDPSAGLNKDLVEFEMLVNAATAAANAGEPWPSEVIETSWRRAELLAGRPAPGSDGAVWLDGIRPRVARLVGGDPGPDTSAAAVPTVGTGAISGTVRDATTLVGISGVSVYIYRVYICGGLPQFVTSATTNASGVYTTPANLDTGTYYVFTENGAGYVNSIYTGLRCFGSCNSTTAVSAGTPIAVTSPNLTTGIDFTLGEGGQIVGTVTNAATLSPVPSVFVAAYTASGILAGSASTNASGVYTIRGLATGSYFLATSNSAGLIDVLYNGLTCPNRQDRLKYCPLTTSTPVSVAVGATTPSINFALNVGGRIGGTANTMNVLIYDSLGWVTYASPSGGNYQTTSGLPSGTYYASTHGYTMQNQIYNGIACPVMVYDYYADTNAFDCDPRPTGAGFAVTAGAITSNINFAAPAGGRISGNVTTGAVVPNARLEVYDATGRIVDKYTSTDGAGNYTTYPVLGTGNYYIRVFSPPNGGLVSEVYNNLVCPACNVTSGTPVAVTAGVTTAGRNFTIAAGSRIPGTITDAIAGGSVYGNAKVYASTGAFVTQAQTDCATGNYRTSDGLSSGTYYVTGSADGYRTQLFSGTECGTGCAVTGGAPVAVNGSSDSANINFALRRFRRPQDLNGDTSSDVLWRHSSGALYVWLMNGTKLTGADFLPAIPTSWVVQAVADFNGDGKADILWREAASGLTYMWFMDGSGQIGGAFTSQQADSGWTIQGVGDFNADGRSDIVWRHSTGVLYLWMMQAEVVGPGSAILPAIDTSWQIKGIGDLNGDGYSDIVWRYTPNGSAYVWLMQGTSTIGGTGYTSQYADGTWTISGVGDMNGDGRSDLLWRHSTGVMYVWLMNGVTVGPGSALLPAISTNWLIQGLRDFNKDGKADILWREAASGSTYMWLMNGAAATGVGFTDAQAGNDWTIQAQQ